MADGRQILEIVMGGNSASKGGTQGGESGKSENALSSMAKKLGLSNENEKETAEGTTGMAKKFDGFVKNQLGISFNLANILKQSQIFTSFVGTIFQLMGALVDVILAPFLPVLIPVITKIARWIPWFQQKSEALAGGLFNFFAWLGGKFQAVAKFFGEVNTFMAPVRNVISSLWNSVMEWKDEMTLGNIYNNIFRAIEHFDKWIKGHFDDIWGKFKFWGDETKKAIDDVPGGIWKYIGIGLKWIVRKAGSLLDNMVKMMLGALPLGSIWKLLYSLGKNIVKFFGNIGLMLAKLIIKGGKWLITEGVGWLMGKITGLLQKLLSPIWDLVVKVGQKIPFVGKAFKNLDNLPLMGKALKRVPVIGTVAQIGFGAYETIQATRKYGLQAGMEFGAKNIAATGAGFLDLAVPGLGTAAAAGIDIGGTIMLERRWQQKMLEKEQQTVVNITQTDANGYDVQQQHFKAQGEISELEMSWERNIEGYR